MHRSRTLPRFLSYDWAKAILHSNHYILCYVGTGWFSLACRRARNWPFWSHRVFWFELMRRSITGATFTTCSLLSSYALYSRSNVVHFPNC